MNTALLLKLADLLDSIPDEQFDYSHWVGGDRLKIGTCGTTACALGWATTLKETGLSAFFVTDAFSGFVPCIHHESQPLLFGRMQEGDTTYKHSIAAGRAAFDLTMVEAEALFFPEAEYHLGSSPPEEASAMDVASWIREVVEDWKDRQETT